MPLPSPTCLPGILTLFMVMTPFVYSVSYCHILCSSGTPVGAKMQSVHYFEGYDRVANSEVQKHGDLLPVTVSIFSVNV